MSSGNDNKKLLLIGTLIGVLGAAALIIGMFIQFTVFNPVDIFALGIIAVAAGIFLICFITFLATITPAGLTVNDERPSLFALLIFIFAPTVLISDYTTPMYFLLDIGNGILDDASVGFGFYLVYIGVALLMVSFLLLACIYLWKNRMSTTGGLNLGSSSEIGIVKLLRIITSILIIVAGAGIVLGFIIAPYSASGDVFGLLMYEDGSHLDLKALTFLILIVGVIITAVFELFSNLGIFKMSKSELPVLAFLIAVIALPGYSTKSTTLNAWTSPVFELLRFGKGIFESSLMTITAFGWILLLSVLALVLTFFLSILTYFFNTSASFTARARRAPRTGGGRLEARRKKGKFPSGPPSSPVGDRSVALSEPTSMTGGSQPTVSSAPPSPPAFMPSSSAAPATSSDKPTCPFCGKNLRFIDEYQRWYCDSCSQYV
ncbi:MAG: hypothetical protein HZR80_09255 [Candidatus Heimdallarchaeota archaeon]